MSHVFLVKGVCYLFICWCRDPGKGEDWINHSSYLPRLYLCLSELVMFNQLVKACAKILEKTKVSPRKGGLKAGDYLLRVLEKEKAQAAGCWC